MKISYKWLQTYFKETLPTPEKVAELFNYHTFEVESVENVKNDIVLDVKVLPDRAPYCLSHQGIAQELSALIDNEFVPRDLLSKVEGENIPDVKIKVSEIKICDRFLAVRVMNVLNKESPTWLKDALFSVGQRSINLVVDLTNFVMLDIGHPMHAFDGELLKGGIDVRFAKTGEKVTTLDNKEVMLDENILVLSDDEAPLDVAGVKGGKKSEVSMYSNHLIVTCGHFDSSYIRKTTNKVGIKNESSKRYENNVSSHLTPLALNYFLTLLKKEIPDIVVGTISEINHTKKITRDLSVSVEFIQDYLGKDFSAESMVEVLNKAYLRTEREGKNIVIKTPEDRLDINIREDVADEVGRLLGYENIVGVLPKVSSKREINKDIALKNKIRNFLINKGYSEVYTYALEDKGDIEIANPLASDKAFMRKDLSRQMTEKLVSNLHYADLLGTDKIRIFEIGKVFPKAGERTSLAIGVGYKKITKDSRPNDEIKEVRDELFAHLGFGAQILCTVDDSGGIISYEGKTIGATNNLDGILELDLDFLISKLPDVTQEVSVEENKFIAKYKPISIYPFSSRDIAVFVPEDVTEDKVIAYIKRYTTDLLVKNTLFDVFTKTDKETGEKKTSYAYRLVFQSYTETLTEDKINKIMENVTGALNGENGWKVR